MVQDRRPVGIVTDRDLALRVVAADAPSTTPVSTVMTVDPTTLPVHATVDTALRTMRMAGSRRLPLVDDDGHLVGIVTHDDIFVSFARELGELGEGIESAVDSSELR
ncbi:MAG: CBS domain-containing protein [Deltaproteobacteria bacterium]|nr:CBS domain-containing protein [Deltaproteobacteria bacterium]